MASAVVGIIGFSTFMKILRLYRFFKNLAKKIFWTVLKLLWFAVKWFFCVGLPFPLRAGHRYICIPCYNHCCTAGSPLYYCKEACCGFCSACRSRFHPYEKLEVQSN